MTVLSFYTVVLVLNLLMAGTLTAWMARVANRALFQDRVRDPILVGLAVVPLGLMLGAIAYLLVWGTWLCHWPTDVRQYAQIEDWAFHMTLRFGGYLALIGMALFPPINEFCSWLDIMSKRLTRLLPIRRAPAKP